METTKSFYSASCDGEALDLTGSRIFFEDLSDDMDGVFPRVNEWTRFANKIDREGISEWFKKQAPHYDGIEKIEEIKYDRFKIYTKNLSGLFGQIGEKQIIENINGIEADISYEWYNSRNGRQQKIANGISIFFENVKAF